MKGRADSETRRREERAAQRREEHREREAQRQADREARAEREAERAERQEERALAAQLATIDRRAKYSIGTALEKCRTFNGAEGADRGCLSRRFLQAAKHPRGPAGKVGTRVVPQAHWDRCRLVQLSF